MSLYTDIGSETVSAVITEFYHRAFQDPMIGHFFFGHDRGHITRMQIDFASNMLGGPKVYRGKSLQEAHGALPLRPPHFARRQVLMREVLEEFGVREDLREAWLGLEARLRPLIIQQKIDCNQ